MKDEPQFKAEAFEEVATFDLICLDKVIERYEDACCKCNYQEAVYELDIKQNPMKEDNDITYEMAEISASERLARVFKSPSMSYQLCFMEGFITGYLHPLQLFLVEKRWGFVEENFEPVMSDQLKEPGPPWLKEQPLSLRQMFGDPKKLVENMIDKTESEKKAKAKKHQTPPKVKRLNALDAITAIQENLKEMARWLREEQATMSDEAIQIPSLPTTPNCDGFELAHSIPKYIRQIVFDLPYLLDEMANLNRFVETQHEHICAILFFWFNTGKEAWYYGKKHVHEMPAMREYEYNRLSYQTLIVVARREHLKMVKYFNSEAGAPFFTPEIARAFDSKLETWEDFQRSFERRLNTFRCEVLSVDKLVACIDHMSETDVEEWSNSGSPWRRYIVPLPQPEITTA